MGACASEGNDGPGFPLTDPATKAEQTAKRKGHQSEHPLPGDDLAWEVQQATFFA
jgi:hypothetical protein